MKLYFAYGANLNIENMRYRCPDAVPVQPLRLAGWRLAFSGVATIQPCAQSHVNGALWAISDRDEMALDVFEGWPTLYRKEIIRVDGMDVMVYVMNSDQPWPPSSGYLETIARGYRDWGLDLACLDRAVATTNKETIDYDMYRSTRTWTDSHVGPLESDVYLESGDDVRWLRDIWRTDRDTSTVE